MTVLAAFALVFGSVIVASPAYADSTLCVSSGSNFSPCNSSDRTSHGYENHYLDNVSGTGIGYWKAYNDHNCTNYVGYMLTQNGDAGHGVAMGNATKWDNTINANPSWGYTINSTPAVGAIAQWEGNDANPAASPGHVAYVEAVSGNTITVSEDNVILSGVSHYRWRTITTTGDWPTRFLHIKDAGLSSGPIAGANRISLLDASSAIWAKDGLGYGGWNQQTSGGSAKAIAVGSGRQSLIDFCDAVWSKDDLSNGGWTQETDCGSASKVRASSTGLRVILDFCGAIYAKNTAIGSGGWVQEAGCGSAKDIQIGGDTQVILDNCDSIWSKNSISAGWTQEAGCGAGKAITVDSNGTRIITNYCNALWAKSGAIGSGGWTQETTCDSVSTVEAGGGVQVIIDLCGAIYAKNNGVSYGGWTQEAGCSSAKALDVGSSGRQVILSLDNAIWAKDSLGNGGWGQQAAASSANVIAVG